MKLPCNTRSLIASSSKKSVAVVTRLKAGSIVAEGGVSWSRCSRSYFKRAKLLSKRTVGGPKRSEGLPYRGPVPLVTVALIAAVLLTDSEGENVPARVRENTSRSALIGENR